MIFKVCLTILGHYINKRVKQSIILSLKTQQMLITNQNIDYQTTIN